MLFANATASFYDGIIQALARIQNIFGGTGIHFTVGETGWPTDQGTDYGALLVGNNYTAAYFQNTVCRMLDDGIDVFFFEAFDDPGKEAVTQNSSDCVLAPLPGKSWGGF